MTSAEVAIICPDQRGNNLLENLGIPTDSPTHGWERVYFILGGGTLEILKCTNTYPALETVTYPLLVTNLSLSRGTFFDSMMFLFLSLGYVIVPERYIYIYWYITWYNYAPFTSLYNKAPNRPPPLGAPKPLDGYVRSVSTWHRAGVGRVAWQCERGSKWCCFFSNLEHKINSFD